jgi:hypothetical protein
MVVGYKVPFSQVRNLLQICENETIKKAMSLYTDEICNRTGDIAIAIHTTEEKDQAFLRGWVHRCKDTKINIDIPELYISKKEDLVVCRFQLAGQRCYGVLYNPNNKNCADTILQAKGSKNDLFYDKCNTNGTFEASAFVYEKTLEEYQDFISNRYHSRWGDKDQEYNFDILLKTCFNYKKFGI